MWCTDVDPGCGVQNNNATFKLVGDYRIACFIVTFHLPVIHILLSIIQCMLIFKKENQLLLQVSLNNSVTIHLAVNLLLKHEFLHSFKIRELYPFRMDVHDSYVINIFA